MPPRDDLVDHEDTRVVVYNGKECWYPSRYTFSTSDNWWMVPPPPGVWDT